MAWYRLRSFGARALDARASSRRPSGARALCAALALFFGVAAIISAQSGAVSGGSAGARPASAADWASLLQSDPRLEEIGQGAEPLDPALYAEAALLASGVRPEALEASKKRLDVLVERTLASIAGIREPLAQAEAALKKLHENGALRSYAAGATTITEILETGRYNCVSSATLYLLVVKRLGIEGAGVKTLDHAFCLVRVEGREVDVETTNGYGFDPGTKKEFTDAFGSVTGFSYVPPGTYGRRWTIGERELISLILSNRASLLEERGRYSEALGLGMSYMALRQDREGLAFAVDRVNNVIADLGRRRAFAEAEKLAREALLRLGPEPRLLELASRSAYNRAAALGEAGRWEEAASLAAELLDQGQGGKELEELFRTSLRNQVTLSVGARDYRKARALIGRWAARIGEAEARQLLGRVVDGELTELAQNRPFKDALAGYEGLVSEAAREGIVLERGRAKEILVYLYGTEANRVAGTGDWLGAAALAAEGSAKAGGDASLLRAADNFRKNFSASAHNRFASLYNARRYAEAKRVLEEALAALAQGDRNLEADLKLVNEALRKP